MIAIYVFVLLGLLGGSVYAVLRANEERKATAREFAKKQRFDSFMKAQSESRINFTKQNRRVS